jgi:hypothetical protein
MEGHTYVIGAITTEERLRPIVNAGIGATTPTWLTTPYHPPHYLFPHRIHFPLLNQT